MAGETILLVDHEAEVAELVGGYLQSEGYVPATAATGQEAVAAVLNASPDLILLEARLPDWDGFELCRKLREATNAPIIFLTSKASELDKVIGLSVGGDDYVSKPFGLAELAARIKAQLRRSRMAFGTQTAAVSTEPAEVLASESVELHLKSHEVFIKGARVELSAKEFQVLAFFMQHARQVLTADQLLQRLWGYETDMETKTVQVHIANLRKKIEPDPSAPRVIVTVRGVGYKYNERTDAG